MWVEGYKRNKVCFYRRHREGQPAVLTGLGIGRRRGTGVKVIHKRVLILEELLLTN